MTPVPRPMWSAAACRRAEHAAHAGASSRTPKGEADTASNFDHRLMCKPLYAMGGIPPADRLRAGSAVSYLGDEVSIVLRKFDPMPRLEGFDLGGGTRGAQLVLMADGAEDGSFLVPSAEFVQAAKYRGSVESSGRRNLESDGGRWNLEDVMLISTMQGGPAAEFKASSSRRPRRRACRRPCRGSRSRCCGSG